LADLVAVGVRDAGALRGIRERIEAHPWLGGVFEPAPGWVVATAPYPGGGPDGQHERQAGLAFAEGREQVRSLDGLVRLVVGAPQRLAEVPGDVGFVHVSPAGIATVSRSPSGRVPFYVARGGEAVTIATTLDLLVRLHPQALVLDPLINAIWTSGFDAPIERRTFLRDVLGLYRGEHAVVTLERSTFTRHWSPRTYARPRVAPEHAGRLRDLLVGTLDRELDPAGGNLVTLSGGVDSSAVAALGAGLLGRQTSTLSVLTPNEAQRKRDLGYIDTLAAEVPLAPRTEIIFGAERRLAALDAPGVPFHVMQPFLCLLPEVVQQRPVSVVYGGEIADNLVGSTLTRFDWARHTTPLGLWRERKRLPFGAVSVRKWLSYWTRRPLGRPVVPFAAELPRLVHPELRAEYAEWRRVKRAAVAHDAGAMPYLALFMEREGLLGMHWEVTSALRMRRCYPFITREVLELAFELHPHELVRRNGSKLVLREALDGLVPARNLQREDKGHPGRAGDRTARPWTHDLPAELAPVLAEGWPPAGPIPYLDVARLRQLRAFVRGLHRSRRNLEVR